MALASDETFMTLAEWRTYATDRNWPEAPQGVTPDAVVEGVLRQGYDFMCATLRWPGVLADSAQAGPLPRTGWVDRERREVTGTPKQVKACQAELARIALTTPLMGGASAGDARLVRKKTGPLEKEWKVASASAQRQDRVSYAMALLYPLGVSQSVGGGVVNVERA